MVTDNGSNFVRAFKEYRERAESSQPAEESMTDFETEDEEEPFDYDLDEASTLPAHDEYTLSFFNKEQPAFALIEEGLSASKPTRQSSKPTRPSSDQPLFSTSTDSSESEEEEEEEEEHNHVRFALPPHFRCASHTLNLLGTTDVDKIMKGDGNDIHKKSFKKLQAFWTRINKSNQAAESSFKAFGTSSLLFSYIFFFITSPFFYITGCHLPTPCVTRWNSKFDSLKKFLAKAGNVRRDGTADEAPHHFGT